MEGVFLTLVGAALFCQSWYVLGLYSEGRTMGIFVGGLGVLSLGAVTLTPMLLTAVPGVSSPDLLAEVTITEMLITVWALYAIGVAAHGLWDFDERAIGFYSAFLAVATIIPFIYYVTELEGAYSNGVWLGMAGASLALAVVAGMMFFALSFSFNVLRLVSGWFLLLGGSTVGIVGLAMLSTAISN